MNSANTATEKYVNERIPTVPTKTSDLMNDGDGTNAFVKTNDPRLSDARTPAAHKSTHATGGTDAIAPSDIGAAAATHGHAISDVTGLADALDGKQGTLTPTQIGYINSVPNKANATDLPYAMVAKAPVNGAVTLEDRTANAVNISSATELTLPAIAVPGRSRDFYLKLTVTNSQEVSIHVLTGVAYSWTGYGNPAKTYAAGTYLLHFTETGDNVFHVEDMLAGNPVDASKITSGTLDAARLPVASDSSKGIVQVDGTTITENEGVISTVGGAGGGGYGTVTVSTNEQNSEGQGVTVDEKFYSPIQNQPNHEYTINVPAGSNVNVNYKSYGSDCHVYKNGVPQPNGSAIGTMVEGDAWCVIFATCLAPDTLVMMADGASRRIDEVEVGNLVATPFGPDVVTEVSLGFGKAVDVWRFEDGSVVRTVGRHRFFNVELGEPMYLEAWNIGEHAVRSDGRRVALTGHERKAGTSPHATLFTEKFNLYYADGLLAGNRRSKKCETNEVTVITEGN